jgi:hypothetical protein
MNQKLEAKYVAFIRDLAQTEKCEVKSRGAIGKAASLWNDVIDMARDLHADLLASGYGK